MPNYKHKTEAIAIVLILAVSMMGAIAFMPQAKAQTIYPSYAFLQTVPHEIALGQSVFLVMWVDKPPPTASGILGDRWVGMTVTITKPDGSKITQGPFESDDAGGYTDVYTPDQLGNYSVVFNFPGETLTGSQGNAGFPNITPDVGDVFSAATSAVETFVVSHNAAYTIPQNPLPTGYWQNPVEAFNNNWYVIDGNWLGLGTVEFASTGDYAFTGNFNPYTQAPLTGHIVWTSPLCPGSPGGQMGGEFGGSLQSNYYCGFQYQPKFAPIVINGVLYYDAIPNYSSGGAYQGWIARNLRTGEIIWQKSTRNEFGDGSIDVLICGQVYVYKTMNTYGGQTFLWADRTVGFNTYLDLFDAATGNWICTISGYPGGFFGAPSFQGQDGSLLQYTINSTGPLGPYGPITEQSFTFWNSSVCLNPYNSQFWGLPQGQTIPYTQGIVWSTNLPLTYQGNPLGTSYVFDGVGHGTMDTDNQIAIVTAGAGMASMYEWNTGWLVETAINLNTGAILWTKNQTETPYATTMLCPGASNGVYVEWTKETLTFSGYSTLTGAKVWGPTTP